MTVEMVVGSGATGHAMSMRLSMIRCAIVSSGATIGELVAFEDRVGCS